MTEPYGQKPKIGIVGFADSRVTAPYADDTWELWGVNDLYAYVPRIDVSFELHSLVGIGSRRNPGYEQWLRDTKTPVVMWDRHPEWPSTYPYPREAVMAEFGSYFTNSVSWMLALALQCLTEPTELRDGRILRLARPDAQLGIWGVDMAAQTEYGAQRPSCEFFVGQAAAMGVPTFIPENSDLCKSASLYGLDTTAPLRTKMASRIQSVKQKLRDVESHKQKLLAEVAQCDATIQQGQGAMDAYRYVMGVWTMPTDIPMGAEVPEKDRSLSNGHSVEPVTVGGESHGRPDNS